MNNAVVIIPSRLKAKRLPNKPLELINRKEMILHVHDLAKDSGSGDVLVVTPDKDIAELIKKNGGNSFLSISQHETGTDRVFEGFENFYSSKPKVIINLQGDMPNLDPKAINQLKKYMDKGLCDMATLASSVKTKEEIQNPNIVKVIAKDNIEKSGFTEAIDFKRDLIKQEDKFIYHHIGIYAFTSKALMRYVNLKRSKLELERNLEQMRALENKMKIHVGYTPSNPLSIDTKDDLEEIKKIMEK
tara:strand:- start:928 stop:1662 length:735 start_codon:yes stop_codon:yes gene_type:complete